MARNPVSQFGRPRTSTAKSTSRFLTEAWIMRWLARNDTCFTSCCTHSLRSAGSEEGDTTVDHINRTSPTTEHATSDGPINESSSSIQLVNTVLKSFTTKIAVEVKPPHRPHGSDTVLVPTPRGKSKKYGRYIAPQSMAQLIKKVPVRLLYDCDRTPMELRAVLE